MLPYMLVHVLDCATEVVGIEHPRRPEQQRPLEERVAGGKHHHPLIQLALDSAELPVPLA